MEIKHLETLCVVAETGSFSQAGARLHLAQSTVTTHIQALEQELGVPLFNRLPRQVTLTERGRTLLVYAQRLLALEAEMVAVVSGTETAGGSLTIGASETVLTYRLPALLQTYRERYPAVELRLRPFSYSELLDRLREGSIDVAFLFDQPLQSQSLHIQSLLAEPLSLVAAPGHPLTNGIAVTPADLENQAILFTEQSCGYRTMFEHTLAAEGVRPSTNLEFRSVEGIKQCVIAGLGVTLLPEVAVRKECAAGKLLRLPWSGPELLVWTQIAWSRSVHMSPKLANFIELSRTLLSESAARAAA